MEFRRKCNVCGKIWCYSDDDIKKNLNNSAMSGLAAIGGLASALGGTTAQQHLNYDMSERAASKVVDYSQCPNCHSKDSTALSQEDWEELQLRESFANTRVSINTNATPEALIKRAKLFLEDKDWAVANAYCDNVLDTDPENGQAYLYKLMAELRASTLDELGEQKKPFDERSNYQKALRFLDETTVQTLKKRLDRIYKRINEQKEMANRAAIEQEEEAKRKAAAELEAKRKATTVSLRIFAIIVGVLMALGGGYGAVHSISIYMGHRYTAYLMDSTYTFMFAVNGIWWCIASARVKIRGKRALIPPAVFTVIVLIYIYVVRCIIGCV